MPAWKGIVGRGFSADDFDEYVSGLSFNAWRPQFVVLHNTAAPTLAQWHSVPGATRMANLESYYRDEQKWSGGPHLFVADDLIWVFTPLTVPGVHSPSWNLISWGVEMVGDFDTEEFADPQKTNVFRALAALHAAAGLDPMSLRLHREDPKTTHACPGANIRKADVIEETLATLPSHVHGEHEPGAVT
ncbi:MAG TPA: N-acetylmuramoyl-L-alanine amidase [Bryobacteraceae bacterium]|nr:N-acetylmuramoyl-L-alanine amidase [Bryobacteraceae bacterium]